MNEFILQRLAKRINLEANVFCFKLKTTRGYSNIYNNKPIKNNLLFWK